MKGPIAWNGQCFEHARSDDIYDHYVGPGGRLTRRQATGDWLANIRDARSVASPTKHGAFEAAEEVARAALNGAVEALRRRVAADAAWLAAFDDELGETL